MFRFEKKLRNALKVAAYYISRLFDDIAIYCETNQIF